MNDRALTTRRAGAAARISGAESFEQRETTFVGRSTYRKRRIRDLSRLLPFGGFLLLLVPLNFPIGGGVVRHLVFLFVVWVLLIIAAFFCAIELRPESKAKSGDTGQ